MRISIPLISISWHGGVRVLVHIANYLAEQGHEVTILCSRGRVFSPYKINAGIKVKHVGVRTRWKQLDYAVFLAALPFVIPAGSALIATFFVTYYSVRLTAALRNAKYVYFVQDIESKYGDGVRGRMLNRLCNYTYDDENIIAANSHLQGRILREFGRSCRCIQVGPSDIFYSAPTGVSKKYDIVYFLRREPWKGLDRFRAFLEASRGAFTCLCVSQDESLLTELKALAVTCIKPSDDRELLACLDAARVLFFTSHKEGFALPPLEGMARGLPAVLFRCGGPDLYVQDKINSFYVSDVTEAVRIVKMLATDESLYLKVSLEARSTADSFRMHRALQQFEKFLVDGEAADLRA